MAFPTSVQRFCISYVRQTEKSVQTVCDRHIMFLYSALHKKLQEQTCILS